MEKAIQIRTDKVRIREMDPELLALVTGRGRYALKERHSVRALLRVISPCSKVYSLPLNCVQVGLRLAGGENAVARR